MNCDEIVSGLILVISLNRLTKPDKRTNSTPSKLNMPMIASLYGNLI